MSFDPRHKSRTILEGTDRAVARSMMKAAGFTDVAFRPCHHIERDTGTFPMFLATATRPART